MLSQTPCHVCPLRSLPVFRKNAREEIDYIQSHKVAETSLRPGATIQTEGQADDRLFTLLSGWAFRYKSLPDGRRQILNFLLPGDLIGLQSKLFAEAPHGVETLTAATLCAFSRDRTLEVFSRFPQIAFDLTWLCAHEERLIDEELLSVGRRTAIERVSMLFAHLWHRACGIELVVDGTLLLPLTQTHIADALGLSAVHVNRTLQALRRRGLIELGNGSLRMQNLAGLKQIARYEPPSEVRPLY